MAGRASPTQPVQCSLTVTISRCCPILTPTPQCSSYCCCCSTCSMLGHIASAYVIICSNLRLTCTLTRMLHTQRTWRQQQGTEYSITVHCVLCNNRRIGMQVLTMVNNQHYLYRMTVLVAMTSLASVVSHETLYQTILPAVISCAQDKVSPVVMQPAHAMVTHTMAARECMLARVCFVTCSHQCARDSIRGLLYMA